MKFISSSSSIARAPTSSCLFSILSPHVYRPWSNILPIYFTNFVLPRLSHMFFLSPNPHLLMRLFPIHSVHPISSPVPSISQTYYLHFHICSSSSSSFFMFCLFPFLSTHYFTRTRFLSNIVFLIILSLL